MLNTCTVHTHQNFGNIARQGHINFGWTAQTPPSPADVLHAHALLSTLGRACSWTSRWSLTKLLLCLGKYIDIKLRGFHQIKYWVAGFEHLIFYLLYLELLSRWVIAEHFSYLLGHGNTLLSNSADIPPNQALSGWILMFKFHTLNLWGRLVLICRCILNS